MIYTHVLNRGAQGISSPRLGSFAKQIYPERIRLRAVIQVATSAMHKQIGGMCPSLCVRGRRANIAFDFDQIKIHIVGQRKTFLPL